MSDPGAVTVPDAVAPPSRHRRFELIDGVRAIAVLCVVVVHAAVFGHALGPSLGGRLLAHLNVGVTIFFLVSGFLLYRPFVAHRVGDAFAPSVRQYAKRRLLRIFPAYWLVLTVLILVRARRASTVASGGSNTRSCRRCPWGTTERDARAP